MSGRSVQKCHDQHLQHGTAVPCLQIVLAGSTKPRPHLLESRVPCCLGMRCLENELVCWVFGSLFTLRVMDIIVVSFVTVNGARPISWMMMHIMASRIRMPLRSVGAQAMTLRSENVHVSSAAVAQDSTRSMTPGQILTLSSRPWRDEATARRCHHA